MRASGYERAANDYYVEPRSCIDALLDAEEFTGSVWDPACGGGNIPRACNDRKLWAMGTDIADRGYGARADFLDPNLPGCMMATSIISNPPFRPLRYWVDVALRRTTDRVAVLARLAFLEGQERRSWFATVPLCRVYVLSKRISMPPGGTDVKAIGGSIAYAWFLFAHGFHGEPVVRWLA
jgi:hypothetical protein